MSFCPHCVSGQFLSFGRHVRITTRGTEDLGPCPASEEERAELDDRRPPVNIGPIVKAWLERMKSYAVPAPPKVEAGGEFYKPKAMPTPPSSAPENATHWSEEPDHESP